MMRLSKKPGRVGEPPAGRVLFDQYVESAPSAQNAVDAVPGWNGALPPDLNAVAGPIPLYDDHRIRWCVEQLGGVEGASVLELGPLEGAHTAMLERAGAGTLLAIEANRLAFLRCLVTKELFGLTRSRFRLGNFLRFLEETPDRFDLIVASGVLYHMPDPLRLLELVAQSCRSLYLWTHYVDETAMPVGDLRRSVFVDRMEVRPFHGIEVRLYPRSYHHAEDTPVFCGGMSDEHRWVQRDDLLAALRVLGFTDLVVAHDEPGHKNGPSFSVLARKPD